MNMDSDINNNSHIESELHVISRIMQDSRNVIIDNGVHYIFWGVLVTCALLINYAMVMLSYSVQQAGMMWFVMMTAGAITDYFIVRRRERQRKVSTFAGKVLSSLWAAAGFCMFMFGFIGVITGAYNALYICPIISVVLGMTYYISGVIQQIKWMQFLTAGWWLGALYMFAFPTRHTLLLFAIMLILFQVTPGIILYRQWKKEKTSSEG